MRCWDEADLESSCCMALYGTYVDSPSLGWHKVNPYTPNLLFHNFVGATSTHELVTSKVSWWLRFQSEIWDQLVSSTPSWSSPVKRLLFQIIDAMRPRSNDEVATENDDGIIPKIIISHHFVVFLLVYWLVVSLLMAFVWLSLCWGHTWAWNWRSSGAYGA